MRKKSCTKMRQQQMHSWYSAWQQKLSSGITHSSSSSRMTGLSSVRKPSGGGWVLLATRLSRRHKPQQQLHSMAAGG
jgi:hypothetical protein